MVLVQYVVTVNDKERFKKTYDAFADRMKEEGIQDPKIYWDENEPNRITMMERWESHDRAMEVSDKYGEEFQAQAGTEGLDWDTYIWHEWDD